MGVGTAGRASTLKNALSEAHRFGLDPADARTAIETLVDAAHAGWPEAAERAGLTAATRALLARETVLGPGCFE